MKLETILLWCLKICVKIYLWIINAIIWVRIIAYILLNYNSKPTKRFLPKYVGGLCDETEDKPPVLLLSASYRYGTITYDFTNIFGKIFSDSKSNIDKAAPLIKLYFKLIGCKSSSIIFISYMTGEKLSSKIIDINQNKFLDDSLNPIDDITFGDLEL